MLCADVGVRPGPEAGPVTTGHTAAQEDARKDARLAVLVEVLEFNHRHGAPCPIVERTIFAASFLSSPMSVFSPSAKSWACL